MDPVTPREPSRSDLPEIARLAEWEIKRLEDAKKESGWSPWMLYVALAGLSWRLVDEFDQPHSWAHVALYWATFMLLANFTTDLLRLLSVRPRDRTPGAPPRFFSANKLLGSTRPYLLFVAMKVTGAALLIVLTHTLTGIAKLIWALLFGSHFFGWLTTLTMSFLDMPLPVSVERPHAAVKTGVAIAYLLNIAAMFFMCREIWPIVTRPFSASDLKVALILFACAEILSLLLSHTIGNPIRDNLVQLRRAIAFAEIGYDDAKSRLDLILHGAEISQYLQPRVQALLAILNDVTREQDAVNQSVAAARDLMREPPTPERVKALREASAKTKTHVTAVATILKRAEQALDDFNLRVASVAAADKRVEEEIRPLRENLKQQIETAAEKKAQLEKEFQTLGRDIDSFIASMPGEPPAPQ